MSCERGIGKNRTQKTGNVFGKETGNWISGKTRSSERKTRRHWKSSTDCNEKGRHGIVGLEGVETMWCHVMSCDVMSRQCDVMLRQCDVEIMWCHIVRSRQCDVMLRQCDVMWCHVMLRYCGGKAGCFHVMSLQCDVIAWGRDNVMSCCNNVMSCDVVMWCRYNVMSCREVTTMWCCNIVVDKLEVALWTCSFSGDLWCWPWFRPEFSEKKLKNGGGGENQKMLTIIILF